MDTQLSSESAVAVSGVRIPIKTLLRIFVEIHKCGFEDIGCLCWSVGEHTLFLGELFC